MDDEASVYIILLNYCNFELTMDCIHSIRESSYKNVQIIVVDNASPDGSGANFLSIPSIHFIQNDSNAGFSYGNNLGIKYALSQKADYLMLLNNDTVIDKEMISNLVRASGNENVSVPKMYYFDKDGSKDIIWYAGGIADMKKCNGEHIGLNKKDSQEYSVRKKVSFATGCCILIPRKVIESTGYLDDEYFMYCEDLDYSIRLNKNCINIIYEPSAKLWHKVSASSGGEMSKFIVYYVVRNRVFCAIKNKLGWKVLVYIFLETVNRTIKGFLGLYYKSYISAPKAYFDGLRCRMGVNGKL